MFDDVLKHRSGRVIALARTFLAAIFLFAIWIDPTQPTRAAAPTYALLGVYLAVAIGLSIATWDDWWLDAKVAAPAHVLDIVIFTLLVLASDGYTSPFFVFFAFLVLSAAIRWGWQETALTAGAVIALFFATGLLGGQSPGVEFDLQRFIIRSGNLVILSALLIWFGINYGFADLRFARDSFLPEPSPHAPALEVVTSAAMRATGAARALLLWRDEDSHSLLAIAADGEGFHPKAVPASALKSGQDRSFLFDLRTNHGFTRDSRRRMRFFRASTVLDPVLAEGAGITEGLATPIHSATGDGILLLGGIKSLCTDHVDLGEQLGHAITIHIQRQALVSAVEEGATAKARLSLARDLHDSIVQFLAGATFRIEAISRGLQSGEKPERELKDLKQMMLDEQQELRSAIGALRAQRISLPTLAAEIRVLCDRLARQWGIACAFSAEVPDVTASMRLHLDAQQLIREAVANAVRHGRARSVTVQMAAEDSQLRLDISNDGTASERLKTGSPWSLRERVDEANGTLMLATRETGTSVSITLPLNGEPRP
jgi:signal transduction histidine kinase